MKKGICTSILFVLVFCILFTGCGGMTAPGLNYLYTSFCSKDNTDLTVERETSIEIYLDNEIHWPVAEVCDTFTIYNSSGEKTVKLFYPGLGEMSHLENDGEAWTDWWGGAGLYEIDSTVIEKLNDGTFFNKTFPDWPTLGEPVHEIYSSIYSSAAINGKAESDFCGLQYYVKDITIPENGHATIARNETIENFGKISFLRLNDELPCTRHTLTVTCAPGIELLSQNVIKKIPEESTWTVELDPEKGDYYLLLNDHLEHLGAYYE